MKKLRKKIEAEKEKDKKILEDTKDTLSGFYTG